MTGPSRELKWSQADANGFYWWRLDKNDTPEPVEVRDGMFYSIADKDPTNVSIGEFLGPIAPSDTEQRLREALERALTFFEQYKERHLVSAHFYAALADMRKALKGDK
jgi:hypothetical protein